MKFNILSMFTHDVFFNKWGLACIPSLPMNQQLNMYQGKKKPNTFWVVSKHYRCPIPKLNKGLWNQI
jgi:hypothetical protein